MLIHLVPALLLLGVLDGWLGARGSPHQAVVRTHAGRVRLDERPAARVLILGSSTTGDWIAPRYLSKVFGIPPYSIVDGHIDGCLQDCTWAEVRYLLAQRRHFDVVFLGVNRASECEFQTSTRIAQQLSLLPSAELPRLVRLLLESETPTRSLTWLAAAKLSRGFADRPYAREQVRLAFVGHSERPDSDLWYRAHRPPPSPMPSCSYGTEETHFMKLVSRQLLEDLGKLSDRVVLMLLPDRELTTQDPRAWHEWQLHRDFQRELADAYPYVVTMDLVRGDGARQWSSFNDHVHISASGRDAQRRLFEVRVAELGLRGVLSAALERTQPDAPGAGF